MAKLRMKLQCYALTFIFMGITIKSCAQFYFQVVDMAFRSDESARNGYEQMETYFVERLEPKNRAVAREELQRISKDLGNVVDFYPTWHPLVRNTSSKHPSRTPSKECGYEGLQHTRSFVNGFITCPYDDGEAVLESVKNLPHGFAACLEAEKLNVTLYSESTTAILVRCIWEKSPLEDGTICPSVAMPLLLQRELPCCEWSQVAETWESMRHYFLGTPHGSRSSLFINPQSGQLMKKAWESLIATGIFGPIYKS